MLFNLLLFGASDDISDLRCVLVILSFVLADVKADIVFMNRHQ